MRHRFAFAACLIASLGAVPAAQAADPIMRLSDVRPGMDCKALSVIRGTAISEFDVEVIDVIRGDSAAPGARILIRVSGPAVDATGVGPGFSGSPIYCQGGDGVRRNAGAISESVGEFGNKIALATPIEQILEGSPETPASARSAPALRRSARPIATPLTVSGLSSPIRRRLARAARRADRLVLAAPSGPLAGFPPVDLQPGSSVSAGIAGGDLALGSIGTVAYRSGTAIWAFGHPIDAAGRRALALQDAYVYAVINNPIGTEEAITTKLAVPGHTLGVFSNDGLNQIAGRVGPPPRTIRVRVNVSNSDTGRKAALASDVTDERDLELGSGLDVVGALAIAQASGQVLGAAPPRFSTEMCVRIRLRERRRRLGFCDSYQEAFGPFDDLSAAFGLVDGFKFGRITPTDVSVRMQVRRGVREAFVVAAAAPRRVRPGQRIRVRLLLQRRRGGRSRMSFRMRVPRSLRPGVRLLTLRGIVPASLQDASEDGIELVLEDLGGGAGGGDEAGSRSIPDLAAEIGALGAPDGLRATFSSRAAGRWSYAAAACCCAARSASRCGCLRRVSRSGRLGAVRVDEHVVDRRRALAIRRHEQLEVVLVRGRLEGVLHRHEALLDVAQERLVEGLHPVVRALGDHLGEPPGLLGIHDHVAHPAGHPQDLAGGHAAVAVGGGHQPLGDHALQRAGEHRARLALLGLREEVDDPVHRLGRVHGVHGGEHEVAGLRGAERGPHGLLVTHLADEDHVRVLAQHAAQGALEGAGVLAHLALVDDRELVLVEELDGILDGHDVLARPCC